jgi:hypothetical protein
MIIANTPKEAKAHSNKAGVVNNNYIYDLSEDKLRETNFFFIDSDKVAWN